MKEVIEMIIGWAFPVVTIILIVLVATRRDLKGKSWLIAYLAVNLAIMLGSRAPELLSKLNLLGPDGVSQFYSRFGLPLNVVALIGYCLFIPYVMATTDCQSGASSGAPPPSLPDSPYRGYGGWLALFCAVQLFVQPILAVIMFVVGAVAISDASSQYPGFIAIYLLEALGGIAVVGLGMYAAIRLRGIRPGAVRAAKRYLLVALAWSIVSFTLPYLGNIPDSAREAMLVENIKGFVRTLIPFVIWISYFNVSKRVRATYG